MGIKIEQLFEPLRGMPSMLFGLGGTDPQRLCEATERTPQFQNSWVAVAISSASRQVGDGCPGLNYRPVLLPRLSP